MGLFSLLLAVVPFVIGGIMLLLEHLEQRIDAPLKVAAAAVADSATAESSSVVDNGSFIAEGPTTPTV